MNIKLNKSTLSIFILIVVLFLGFFCYQIHLVENLYDINLNQLYLIIFIFVVLIIFLVLGVYRYLRSEIIKFSNRFLFLLNEMIDEKNIEFETNNETLVSKIEAKLKKLQSSLVQKNLLIKDEKDSVNSLIGDISHQIKTPVANIKIYNELLITLEDNTDKLEYLNLMDGQVEKIEWLINSLFKTSRIEKGIIKIEKENCSLQEILIDIIEQSYLKIEEKDIDLNIESCELELYVDKKWTTEAIYNVFDNAIKYSPYQSKINIKCLVEEFFVKIDIQDNGVGIPDIEINDIFKRFYRGKNQNVDGAGIGLYLTRQILEMQGGFITIKSNVGEGSVFSIYLLK